MSKGYKVTTFQCEVSRCKLSNSPTVTAAAVSVLRILFSLPGGNGEWAEAAMTDLRTWLLKEPPQRGPAKRRAETVGGSTSSVKKRAATVRESSSSSDSSSSSSSSSVNVKRLKRTIAEAEEGLPCAWSPSATVAPSVAPLWRMFTTSWRQRLGHSLVSPSPVSPPTRTDTTVSATRRRV